MSLYVSASSAARYQSGINPLSAQLSQLPTEVLHVSCDEAHTCCLGNRALSCNVYGLPAFVATELKHPKHNKVDR